MTADMTAPEWLTRRDGSLKPGLRDYITLVLLGGQPQYRVEVRPAVGTFEAVVTFSINGKRLDDGRAYPTPRGRVRRRAGPTPRHPRLVTRADSPGGRPRAPVGRGRDPGRPGRGRRGETRRPARGTAVARPPGRRRRRPLRRQKPGVRVRHRHHPGRRRAAGRGDRHADRVGHETVHRGAAGRGRPAGRGQADGPGERAPAAGLTPAVAPGRADHAGRPGHPPQRPATPAARLPGRRRQPVCRVHPGGPGGRVGDPRPGH